MHFQQLTKQQIGVVIMDAFDVTFAVSRSHEFADSFQTLCVIGLEQFLQVNVWRTKHLVRQKFSSINVCVFTGDRLTPDGLGRVEFWRNNGLEIVRAAKVEVHVAVFDDGRQVQRLHIHRKLVRTKLNDILAVNVQFVFITKLTNRVFANRLQATLNVVDFDGLIEFLQLGNDVPNFVDHQVR